MRWNSTSFFDMNFVKSLNKDALILIVPVKNCSRELIITDPIIITIAMFLIIPQYDKQTLDDFEPLLILFLLLLRLLLILFFSFWCSHFVSFHYLAAPFFFFWLCFLGICVFSQIFWSALEKDALLIGVIWRQQRRLVKQLKAVFYHTLELLCIDLNNACKSVGSLCP